MASFHFYGSGNTVSDPFRELAGILTRMAQVECRDDVHYFDTDSPRYERGLTLVLRSVEIRASRWLPREVFECIGSYTQDETKERADLNKGEATQLPELLTAEQCKNVPIKILHILADNYALASRCAKKLAEPIGSDIRDTNPVNFDPVESANAICLHRKYDYVKSQLYRLLSAMGEPCIMNNDTEFAHVSKRSRPVSDPSTDLSSTTIKSTVMQRETKTLKLKRKRKVKA